MLPFAGEIDRFAEEIERRIAARKGSTWFDKQAAFRIRRKKIAAAYLAGASLAQLAILERVTAKAIHDLAAKELAPELRDRVASERTQRGRPRAPAFRPSQISAMMAAVSDQDAANLPVIVIAARMQTAAQGEQDIMEAGDADDPYLRNEAGDKSAKLGEGS